MDKRDKIIMALVCLIILMGISMVVVGYLHRAQMDLVYGKLYYYMGTQGLRDL